MSWKRVFHSASNVIAGGWRSARRSLATHGDSIEVPTLKSGFNQLDRAVGVGGLPQGRLTELMGPDGRGTVSIAARMAAKFQRRQLPVVIIDLAGSFEDDHAARCGLVAPELLRHVPQTAFDLIGLLEQAAREPGLVLANLGFVPHTFAGADPSLLNALLLRIRRIIGGSESAFLFLTLPEESNPFLHTNYLPGFLLNELAEIRLWVQDDGWIKRQGQIGGYRGSITVIKNRLAPSGKGANLRVPFVDPEMARLADELELF